MHNLIPPEDSGSPQNQIRVETASVTTLQAEPSVAGEPEIESQPWKIENRLLSLLSPAEQTEFKESLTHGNASSVPFLARLLARERGSHKVRTTTMRIGAAILGAYALVSGPLYVGTAYPVEAMLSIMAAVSFAFGLVAYDPPGRLEKPLFEALIQFAEQQHTGLLIEQIHVGAEEDRVRVRTALLRLFPQLRPEHISLLTVSQRARLHSILDYNSRGWYIDLRLAVVAALEHIGDRDSLSDLHLLAGGEAATRGEQAVRTAAQKCLHDLTTRLDFGRPDDIPRYLPGVSNPANTPVYRSMDADSLYALISLLPQLTPTNYRQLLTAADRDHLYGLIVQATSGDYAYDQLRLYREVIHAVARVGDTQSMNALGQVTAMGAATDGAKQLRTAAREALQALRQLVEKEKESKTLLRGSSAPDALPGELLRAAAPAESATSPNELLRASIPKQECAPVRTNLTSEESSAVLLRRIENPGR